MMKLLSTVGVTPERPNGFGHIGVALATSVVALVNFLALTFLMRKRIKRLNGREILRAFFKVVFASALMSAVCGFSYYFLHQQFGGNGLIHKLIEVFIPIGLGGIAFLGMAKLLKIDEVTKVYNAFARKLKR